MANSRPDYTTWTVDRLVQKVNELESRLEEATTQGAVPDNNTQTTTSATQDIRVDRKNKKTSSSSRPFDPSRYSTRFIALKFAYLGQAYNGYEHHTNNTTPLPTIEETMWAALRKTRLIFPNGDACSSSAPSSGSRSVREQVDWTGCDYSKCGRTDRGVSAFGQVIGIRVRSARPLARTDVKQDQDDDGSPEAAENKTRPFDHIRDELPYIQLLNRVLPSDIRVYAWCPTPPPDFSARFSCRERRYKYFFTNPAYAPSMSSSSFDSKTPPAGEDGRLNIAAMRLAAGKLRGTHDFRNFCKVDPAKQITNFVRRIFEASVERVDPSSTPMRYISSGRCDRVVDVDRDRPDSGPEMYTFTVAGSAFLWHQVRHMVAVLFLVGQGLESPNIVSDLLDVERTPSRPKYEMAQDGPLVLWDCKFPSADADIEGKSSGDQYTDALEWVYVGDVGGSEAPKGRNDHRHEDSKFGPTGIMSDLWASWHARKIEEVLVGSLNDVVALRGGRRTALPIKDETVSSHENDRSAPSRSVRVFDGGGTPRFVGRYIPVMDKERIEHHEVLNARYAARKGVYKPAGLS